MDERLAAYIRQHLFELVDQYDAQLRAVQGYAKMPEMSRRDLEQRVLTLVAEGLKKNSNQLLIDYIHEHAKQVLAQGFEPEWLQRAVTIAQDIVTPLVRTLEESNFVWQAMSRAQAAAWEMVSQERQRIEAALRDSETRYQIIFDSTPIMFWLKDTQNRTLRINKAAAEFEGVNPADIEGKSAYDLYPREQAEAYYQDDLEVIRTNRPKPGIVEQHTSVGTGKLMWVETGKTPVHNEQGEVVGVLAFAVDITERKRAEEALRQSQQLLQSVMDNIPQAVFWKDKHLVYLGCNRAFAADAGLTSPSDVIGKTDWDMPWKEQAELYRDDDSRVMESGTPKLDYEEPQTTPDGSTIWLRTSKVPMRDAASNVTAVLGMYEDITQRKQLEQQIQESLKRRGFQVQTSTQVAQEIAAAPALDELFRRVVTLVKERFNYYHTQIFRYEPVLDTVVLVTGYSEVGQRMLAEGHKLPMGRGVVGTAAATGQSILATDVRQDSDWRPNPHLPQTRGELAVPIKWRDQMLGILDVQSDRAGALTQEDQLLLEGLCGQIATAMESTHLLEELRRSEAELSEALHIAKLAYWEYDVEKDRFLFNDQFYAIFHTTAAQAGGYQLSSAQYAQQFVHPDDLAVVGPEIEKALTSTERHYSRWLEHRILYADGGIGYVSVNVNVDRDEQGRILRYYGANQDITESKQVESDLRKFKLGLDRSTAAIFITDTDGVITYVNPAFEKIYGFTREEAIGQTPRIIKSGLTTQEQYQHFWQALLSGQTVAGEIVNKVKDGRLIFIDGSNSAILDEKGKIIGFLALHNDITERKQAEEALRRSEAELSTALQIAKLAYWEYDVEKDLFLFNDQFYSIFRTTADREGGYQLSSAQYAQRFVHPADLALVGTEIEKALKSTDRHYTRLLEHRILYADGGVGHISVSVNIDRDEHGRILRYYGANQDITARWQAEEALKETEERFRVVAETVPVPILISRATDGTILYGNDQLGVTFGLPIRDLIGRQTPNFYFTPDDRQPLMAQLKRDGMLRNYELHVKRADGTPFWVLVSMRPITFADQSALLAAFYDITDRKQAEEKAQNALREMERLYASVAREGWQVYRQTANLPEAYLYDRSDVQPVKPAILPPVDEAVTQLKLVTAEIDRQTVATAPLDVRGEVVGALGVYDNPSQPLPAEDLDLVKAVSEQVALALESARLFDQTQMALAETRALFRFSDLVSRETGIKAIYDGVAQLLVEEIGFASAWIALVDTQAQVLRGIAGAGLGMGPDRNFDIVPYQHIQTPATIAARDRVMIVANDPLHDERLSDLPDQLKVVVGKAIAIPIIIDGEIESVIAATRQIDGSDIGERDQRLLQTAAVQVAIAVQRARLFEQTQRDAERERTINRIAGRIRNAQSVDQVLEITAQELSSFAHASRSVVEIRSDQHLQSSTGNSKGVKA